MTACVLVISDWSSDVCSSDVVDAGIWHVQLRDAGGRYQRLRARALVNACGPWAGRFLGDELGRQRHPKVRLVKGSHIVLPRLFEHDYAYIFQQPDRRFVFAIPYEGDYTLVGTTDVEFRGDPARVCQIGRASWRERGCPYG